MKKLTLVAFAAASALTLAACGGGTATKESTSTSTSSSSASSGSSSSTSGASSSSTTSASSTSSTAASGSSILDAKVGDVVDGSAFTTVVGGAFDVGQSGHFTMDMGGGMTAEADFVVVEGGRQNTHMTMSLGGMDIETISIGDTTYMKGLAGGDKWVKSSATEAAESSGIPSQTAMDPEKLAKAMSGIEMKVVATEGDTTTFAADLDIAKIMAASDLPTMPTGMSSKIPVKYTLDKEGRPVKISMNLGLDIAMTYSDWGKKVTIEAPPAAEVTTL